MTQEEIAEKLLLENLNPGEKIMLFGPGKFNCGLSRGQFYGAFLLSVIFFFLALVLFKFWPFVVCVGIFAVWRKTIRQAPASNAEFYAVTNNRLLAIGDDSVSTLAGRSELSKIAAKEDKVTVLWQNQILVIEPIRKSIGG